MSTKPKEKRKSGLTGDKEYFLTKTTYGYGLQCPKRLYFEQHCKDLAAPDSPKVKLLKQNGIDIGFRAHKQFPEGVLIERDAEKPAVEATEEAMNNGALTIFEATFEAKGVLVRVDVLHRETKKSPWELIEVKSSTKIKDEHYPDLAIQTWVLREKKVPLAGSFLMLVDTTQRFPNITKLLKKTEDLTKDLEPYIKEVPKHIKEMKRVLEKKKAPDAKIGRQCDTPHECPFQSECNKNVPKLSVLDLYRQDIDHRFDMFHAGIIKITDKRVKATDLIGKRMIQVEKDGEPHFDKTLVEKTLNEWKPPFYHLDFETVMPPIPRHEGMKAFQAFPIQFSLLFQEEIGAEVKHYEYLHSDKSDPRPAIAKALCKWIKPEGRIVAFNASFEARFLRELAAAVPECSSQLLAMTKRMIDPLPLFREAVYYSEFRGHFKLKHIAPALLGKKFDYSLLDISEGGGVEYFFNEFINEQTSEKRKEELRRQMSEYCKVDTVAVAELVNWLKESLKKKK